MSTKKLSQRKTTAIVKKPQLPRINRNTIGAYGLGSFVTYLKGDKIKKLIEFIAERDPENLYNTKLATYRKKVTYYLKVKNPEYRDYRGNALTEKEYQKSKCGIKSRKEYRYVHIPLRDYKKYDLENESATLSKQEFESEYNNARKIYGGENKVGGRCW